MDELRPLRATRSRPELGAPASPARRKVFATALEQFEQLMAAAAAVGPAARPLPLFYALSQAGRAVAAARLVNRWQLSGHGLQFRLASGQDPARSMISVASGARDSFSGVSAVVGSPLPTRAVELAEVWASIVELADLPLDDDRPRPVRFHGDWFESKPPYLLGTVGNLPGTLDLRSPDDVSLRAGAADRLATYLAAFPTLSGGQMFDGSSVNPPFDNDGWSAQLRWHVGALAGMTDEPLPRWRGLAQRFAEMADPALGFDRACWALPSVGGVVLKPLMSWWIVLYAMSMLARYHPAEWGDWLDIDNSLDAVAIETTLVRALEALPDLVLRALSGYSRWFRGA